VRSNGWQNEFAIHQSNGRSATAQGNQAVQQLTQNRYVTPNWLNGQYNFDDGYMAMAPMPYSYGQQQQIQGQQQSEQQAEPMYDEAGFADAFEQASQHAQEMVKDRHEEDRTIEREGSDLLHKDAIPMDDSEFLQAFPSMMRSPSPTQIRIGSDAIPYQGQKTRTPDQDNRDADELARTAGQLLNSVQHDTSDKFQNSQFLALMRKIRDGEVRVEGEEFKETHGSDNMVSNPCGSVVHRAKKECNLLRPLGVSMKVVSGLHETEAVRPTHYHEGQVLDFSNPKHRKCAEKLFETAAQYFSAKNHDSVIQYAFGLFGLVYFSRLEALEPSARTLLSGRHKAALKALRDVARALKPRKKTTGDPIPLSMFDEPFEFDKPGKHKDPLLTGLVTYRADSRTIVPTNIKRQRKRTGRPMPINSTQADLSTPSNRLR
jgi:hypothetical protein